MSYIWGFLIFYLFTWDLSSKDLTYVNQEEDKS